jgi:hypothetical protein
MSIQCGRSKDARSNCQQREIEIEGDTYLEASDITKLQVPGSDITKLQVPGTYITHYTGHYRMVLVHIAYRRASFSVEA